MAQIWKKVEEVILPDSIAFLDRWILLGPMFLLFAASSILLKVAPFQGVTLLFASFIPLILLQGRSLFSKSCLVFFALFSFFCLQGQPRDLFAFNAVWVFSLLLSSLLLYYLLGQVKEKQGKLKGENETIAKDLELWQSRFHTIKEKLREDREVLEGEIEEAHVEKEKAIEQLASLKKLSGATHHRAESLESDLERMKGYAENLEKELEESKRGVVSKEAENFESELSRIKTYAASLEKELEESKKELQIKEEVVQQRQMRNQTLLAKKTTQSISLRDLAKKI